MARAPDVVQFQCVMPPELRNALDKAAIDLRVPGGETASLDRGEMSRRLFRWFLALPAEDRARIVAAEKPVERTEPPSPALPEVVGLTAVEMPRPRRTRAKAGPKRAGRP